jgi:hypothetical protein
MKRIVYAVDILLIIAFVLLFATLALCAPTTQQTQWMQAIVDSTGAKQLGLSRIEGTFGEGVVTATVTPSQTLPTPTPVTPTGGILVGPNGLLKNLQGMTDGRAYYLQPGLYDVDDLDWKKDTAIIGIDPDHPPVLRFDSCWDKDRPAGPDPLSPRREGTFHGYAGTFTMKNVRCVGGPGVDPADMIVFGTDPKASLIVDNVTLDGGGIWRGSGGQKIRIRAQSTGNRGDISKPASPTPCRMSCWTSRGCSRCSRAGFI